MDMGERLILQESTVSCFEPFYCILLEEWKGITKISGKHTSRIRISSSHIFAFALYRPAH